MIGEVKCVLYWLIPVCGDYSAEIDFDLVFV